MAYSRGGSDQQPPGWLLRTQAAGNLGGEAMIDSEVVPLSLVEIAPILRAANEVEPSNPRVAYICRKYAGEKAHALDPISSGRGVRGFKAALLQRLEMENESTLEGQTKNDAREMQIFYEHYYEKYIQALQNDDKADRTRLTKKYQTASVLFEVLKAVQTKSVQVVDEVLEAHTKVAENTEMYALHNILPRDAESSNQAIMRYPEMKHLNHLKIPLQAIKNCTQDFNEGNVIGKGGYGRVYKGILSWEDHVNQPVAVKRLDVTGFQGNKEFYNEVTMLSQYQHENIITLIGFCDDNKEMILVYEYASYGSLDTYLSDVSMLGEMLSWPQRLNICIGAASALDYLHNHVAAEHRIIHRDIKSSNILLDENWNAKLSDFGLSRIGLANQQNTFVITNLAGTPGYCDPQYERTGILTKESDVFSFGVVLFEVLCGRLACVLKYHDERRFLHYWARICYENGEIGNIIYHGIKEHVKPRTLSKFSAIAYQCLHETREARPTIAEVVLKLENMRELQVEADVIRTSDLPPPPPLGAWGHLFSPRTDLD